MRLKFKLEPEPEPDQSDGSETMFVTLYIFVGGAAKEDRDGQ